MTEPKSTLSDYYGNRLRVRVCGILTQENKILLVKHTGLGKEGYFWSPPGGGLQYGEAMQHCLEREFREETGLEVQVHGLFRVHEFLELPLHAIELFHLTSLINGNLITGFDPETPALKVIKKVEWLTFGQIMTLPETSVHPVVREFIQLTALPTPH